MTTEPDRRVIAVVRFKGEEDADLYQCIQSITVTEDLDRGSSFRIRMSLMPREDGSYALLDNDALLPWNRVTVIAVFPEHEETVIDGYVSHVDPQTSSSNVSVDVRGVDASYVMNLEEKRLVWTGKTYEEIAEEIIRSYEFEPMLPPSAASEDEPPAVTQRSTDLAFLRELARRKGYEFFVHGGHAFFRPADLSGEPQKTIAVNFGDQSNCDELRVSLDGTRPTRASMSRLDPLSGEVETVTAESSDLEPLGNISLADLRGYGAPPTSVEVRRQGAATEAQMNDMVQGILRRHGWWIRAEGKLDGLCYGHVLRSRKLVPIKGLGQNHNGNYYVRRVVHKLGARSYQMEFAAVRNGIEQTGSEDFTAEMPDASPIPVAAGAGADADSIAVADSGNQVLPEV